MRCVINHGEYEFLKRIAENPSREIDESGVDYGAPLEASLRERGLIDAGFGKKTGANVCYVTELGVGAIEEYEQNQRQQKREEEALALSREDAALSKEANALSKEAKDLARKANEKAEVANRKAAVSNWVAIASLVLAAISLALTLVFGK